jgi:tetratricopeptide (TPR) repeat protein
MGIMNLKSRQEFQKLHASGMKAIQNGRYHAALELFTEVDTLASHSNNDRRKRLDALNPMACSLWSLGRYEKGKQKLAQASKIASELGLRDELAIAYSNLGRLEAVRIVNTAPVSKQPKMLRKDALPYFIKAQKMLDGHDHLYYRYANAKHGSLVAALAQDYKKAALLTTEGLGIAFKKSRKYDKEATYKLSLSAWDYFVAATELVKLGTQNPASRDYKAQEKIARELVK